MRGRALALGRTMTSDLFVLLRGAPALLAALSLACAETHEPGAAECDVLRQTGCEPGQACHPHRPSGGADPITLCLEAGAAEVGEGCSFLQDCVAGAICHGAGVATSGRCVPYCDLARDPDCSGAEAYGFELFPGVGVRFPACADTDPPCPEGLECVETTRHRVCLGVHDAP